MARSATVLSLIGLAFAVLVEACGGDAGDSCRQKSDCSGALICCLGGVPTSGGSRGVCQSGCVSVDVDAGVDSGP